MARGVNKVVLIGNLGADPDTRYMPSGGAVTNISIATSEQWTDKATNEKQERTEWHRVVLFNRLGEIAAEYLRKGSQVYIEGSIRTDKYQDKQTGQDRYSTQIIARDMQLLGTRDGGPPNAGTQEAYKQHAQQRADAPANADRAATAGGDFDDDVPFGPVPWGAS